MNNTNRAANRILITVVGVLVLAAGLTGILLGAADPFRAAWRRAGPKARRGVSDTFANTLIPGTHVSLLSLAGLVVLAAVIVLLAVFIARQGGGRTGVLIRSEPGEHGGVVIDAAFAEQLLHDALRADPALAAARVTTYRVGDTAMLKVAVTCRRGVPPNDVVETVDRCLAALDRLLGHRIPAFTQLSGGFRAGIGKPAPLP